jgi:predicted DNA-binding ribbon-helix-helix protein
MSDYGFWAVCHKEATRRGIAFNELVAKLCQQYLKLDTELTNSMALLLACEEGMAKGKSRNYNIAGFMEMCCRNELGYSAVGTLPQEQSQKTSGKKGQEIKRKGSFLDLNRDA